MNLDNHYKRNVIIFWVIVLLFTCLITFTGCRTVKKDWLKENYVEKTELKKIEQSISNSNSASVVSEDFVKRKEITELIKSLSEKTTTNETETTTIKANIKAEEGKEKSVTVGSTKIISNGANVSVETTSNKAYTKQFESFKEQLAQKYSLLLAKLETTEKRLDSTNIEFANLVSNQKTESISKSRNVSKKQIGFGIVVLLILIGAYLLLRKRFRLLP